MMMILRQKHGLKGSRCIYEVVRRVSMRGVIESEE